MYEKYRNNADKYSVDTDKNVNNTINVLNL